MNLNLLKTFIKIVDCGSLTQAAKVLKHPKSKISRDLTKLENELELTLLNRSSKGIVPTEQGQKLLKSIRKPLDNLNSSLDQFNQKNNEMKGSIKITAPEDLALSGLTKIINKFMNIYPEIRIDLYSSNSFLDFNEYEIDLALRIGKLPDSKLIQKKIFDIELILVGSSHYIKNASKINKIDDLKSHPVAILTDTYGTHFNKTVLQDIQPQFTSNSIPVLKDYVVANKGIATLPDFFCKKRVL